MAKTYRSWAEVDDWSIGREFRRPHKRKSNLEWKKEAEIEMVDTKVFIVVNEWTDTHNGSGMEIIDGAYFTSESAALVKLRSIAQLKDVDLDDDEWGFTLEDQGTIQYEEYYIQELEEF